GSAGKTGEKIQEQIDDLKVAEAEFNRMASVDPTVINEHKAAGSLKNGLLHTRLGIMEQNPQNTLDVRLTEVNDPIGRLFKKIDRLFKENIIKSLGFSDGLMAKSSGINAEQLAKINWYKEKLAS
ncbi:MAG: hypothetical protein LBU26_02475, partial [Synergistaceae bacterium]|nr:hypothetical protein [Synergistaceae bacterium]